ncbi:hypothetical protein ACW2QC_07490 [Virgibacillus sp. FSP13]
MTPTKELRTRLRKLLNERIPSDGSADDTNFADGELDELISENNSIYAAASFGWTEKAALLQGDIEQYSAGDERYTLTSLKDKLSHAMQMAAHYGELGKTDSGGGFMFKVTPPEVL